MADTDIVVVCEAGKGQNEAANARLIATAVTLAEHWGGRIVCMLAGHGIEAQAAELSRYADEVHLADAPRHALYDPHVHLEIAQKLVQDLHPRIVLMGHTYIGMDLAPRLASRLGTGLASNCFDVKIEADAVYFMRSMYRGRIHAKVVMDSNPMIATIQTGGTAPQPERPAGTVKRIEVAPMAAPKIRPVKIIEPDRSGIDITKAEIVVSGGRGIGEKDNYALVIDLAAALGGVPACSRPLVDMGWFGVNQQVGLSGNTVKPKLYIACGISGALEHLHGMKEAGFIVAINQDPDAPIFKVAHCGLVGDLNEIVPLLTEELKARRTANS